MSLSCLVLHRQQQQKNAYTTQVCFQLKILNSFLYESNKSTRWNHTIIIFVFINPCFIPECKCRMSKTWNKAAIRKYQKKLIVCLETRPTPKKSSWSEKRQKLKSAVFTLMWKITSTINFKHAGNHVIFSTFSSLMKNDMISNYASTRHENNNNNPNIANIPNLRTL